MPIKQVNPMIILDKGKMDETGEGGKMIDVVPFDLEVYRGYKKSERREFESFNRAIDEYFSRDEFAQVKAGAEQKHNKKLDKVIKIEKQQIETIKKLEKKSVEFKEIGDIIYSNFQDIDEIISRIREAHNKGESWKDIRKKIVGKTAMGIKIEDVAEDGSVILSVQDSVD